MPDHLDENSHQIIYVADPMCSWCWGFSPVIHAIEELCRDRASIVPIMGGLRPLTRTPMDEASKSEIMEHWNHVNERSGQPFDMAFFDRQEFIYDTEPACRAVCTMRKLNPDLTLFYLAAVHRAFYAENRDVTDGGVLAEIAMDVGMDSTVFLNLFNDVTSVYETAGDFQNARQMGINGYPSVILRKDEEYSLLSAGYQSFDALQEPIEEWLAQD